MTFVIVCVILVGAFAGGYYLLDHFSVFMRKVYKDSYGDEEEKGIMVFPRKKKDQKTSDQFTYEAVLEEDKED